LFRRGGLRLGDGVVMLPLMLPLSLPFLFKGVPPADPGGPAEADGSVIVGCALDGANVSVVRLLGNY
jgi:hypothetical protein